MYIRDDTNMCILVLVMIIARCVATYYSQGLSDQLSVVGVSGVGVVAPPTPVMDSCTMSRSSCGHGWDEMVSMETSSASMSVA